ncbi:MAG: hypothetical protein ACI9WS_001621 [Paraglaciecola psychrophila]
MLIIVANIAQRTFRRSLTAAKKDSFGRCRFILDRCKGSAFMAAVAEGLLATLAARTPPIVFAFFYVDSVWAVAGANGIIHYYFPF